MSIVEGNDPTMEGLNAPSPREERITGRPLTTTPDKSREERSTDRPDNTSGSHTTRSEESREEHTTGKPDDTREKVAPAPEKSQEEDHPAPLKCGMPALPPQVASATKCGYQYLGNLRHGGRHVWFKYMPSKFQSSAPKGWIYEILANLPVAVREHLPSEQLHLPSDPATHMVDSDFSMIDLIQGKAKKKQLQYSSRMKHKVLLMMRKEDAAMKNQMSEATWGYLLIMVYPFYFEYNASIQQICSSRLVSELKNQKDRLCSNGLLLCKPVTTQEYLEWDKLSGKEKRKRWEAGEVAPNEFTYENYWAPCTDYWDDSKLIDGKHPGSKTEEALDNLKLRIRAFSDEFTPPQRASLLCTIWNVCSHQEQKLFKEEVKASETSHLEMPQENDLRPSIEEPQVHEFRQSSIADHRQYERPEPSVVGSPRRRQSSEESLSSQAQTQKHARVEKPPHYIFPSHEAIATHSQHEKLEPSAVGSPRRRQSSEESLSSQAQTQKRARVEKPPHYIFPSHEAIATHSQHEKLESSVVGFPRPRQSLEESLSSQAQTQKRARVAKPQPYIFPLHKAKELQGEEERQSYKDQLNDFAKGI